MSKIKTISAHEDALSIYLDDMLYEASTEIPKRQPLPENVASFNDDWKNAPFQAISFDVNGLNLAIHEQEVKAILPWSETQLAPISETAKTNEAILGSFQHAPHQTKIINAPYIFLPPELRHNSDNPTSIIILGEGKWALSCHKINSVISLSPDDIKWRKKQGTRPWLAGTSVTKKCSIINVAELVQLLK